MALQVVRETIPPPRTQTSTLTLFGKSVINILPNHERILLFYEERQLKLYHALSFRSHPTDLPLRVLP